MNTEIFTGKAKAYAKARPGYPDAVLDYIKSLVWDGMGTCLIHNIFVDN